MFGGVRKGDFNEHIIVVYCTEWFQFLKCFLVAKEAAFSAVEFFVSFKNGDFGE